MFQKSKPASTFNTRSVLRSSPFLKQQPARKSSFFPYVIFFLFILGLLAAGYYYDLQKNKVAGDIYGQATIISKDQAEQSRYEFCQDIGCYAKTTAEKHPVCKIDYCLKFK